MSQRSAAILTSLLWLCLVSVLPGQTVYNLYVDTFDSNQSINTGTNNPESSTLTDATVLGGTRTLTLETFRGGTPSGDTGQILRSDTFSPGFLELSTGSTYTSNSSVLYDSGGGGLGGVDLTIGGSTHFLFDILSQDNNSATWELTVFDTSGNRATLPTVHPGGMTSLNLAFDDFIEDIGNSSNTDFALVDSVKLSITSGAAGLDYTMDNLGVGTIPEPRTSVLALLGGLLLISRRRGPQEATTCP